jgi:chemotaxis protein methyltransferase CheR
MTRGRLVLSDAEFAALRALLARLAGLVFDESRRDSVAFCIAERLRATGAADVPSYLDLLQSPTERQALLDEVTIQETHFFRNPPQIRALRAHVVPELLRHADARGRRIRVWSAGCSTGEEPYTIAMLLRELLPSTAGWDVQVIATDVSARALAAARSGRYGERAVQMVSAQDRARFFQPGRGGSVEVRPEVRELVEFRHHNLVTEPVPFAVDEGVDLVLCRNVTIYFSRETTRALMARLHACLRDGGYLFLGHSETLWQVSEDFRLVSLGSGDDAAFVYRRLDEGPGERRAVLPDRRTRDTGPPPDRRERRVAARRAAEVPPPAPRPVSIRVVRDALAEGRYDDAEAAAAELLTASPLDATGFYLRGLARGNLGRDADALPDLRKAVYLDPSAGLAHFLLAGTLARLGDSAAAAREYAAAAETLRPADETAAELGGRSVAELAALCRRLAEPVGESA